MSVFIIQPALPFYRLKFFSKVSDTFDEKLFVYYSDLSIGFKKVDLDKYAWARPALVTKFLAGQFYWQLGLYNIPVKNSDIVVIPGNIRNLSLLPFLVVCRLRGAKVVWWSHLRSSTSTQAGLTLRVLLSQLSNALLFYTDCEVVEFRSKYKILSRNRYINALNNGIDIAPIVPLRSLYDSRLRSNSMLFIGRLTKKANLELVFLAMSKLGEKSPHLHIIGSGELREYLEGLESRLGLSERVTWHLEQTDEEYIASIANLCRIFVYPGEVGLSLVHGMAYGLPALVHCDKSKHMPEYSAFLDGETGLSFTPNSSNSLAERIVDLLSDEVRLNSFSSRAVDIVDSQFNVDIMTLRFLDLLNYLRKS